MNNADLIAGAERVLNPRRMANGRFVADVGATLVTAAGNVYSGVSIDTPSGTGFCAEHSAIAAMVTAGEYRISRIVAVWRDESGSLHVLSPCGRCREFMRQVDAGNLDADVVLSAEDSIKLPICFRTPTGANLPTNDDRDRRVRRVVAGAVRAASPRARVGARAACR